MSLQRSMEMEEPLWKPPFQKGKAPHFSAKELKALQGIMCPYVYFALDKGGDVFLIVKDGKSL